MRSITISAPLTPVILQTTPFTSQIVRGFQMHSYRTGLALRPYLVFLLSDSTVKVIDDSNPGATVRSVEGIRYYDRNVVGSLLTDLTLDFDMIPDSFTIVLRKESVIQFINGCGIRGFYQNLALPYCDFCLAECLHCAAGFTG